MTKLGRAPTTQKERIRWSKITKNREIPYLSKFIAIASFVSSLLLWTLLLYSFFYFTRFLLLSSLCNLLSTSLIFFFSRFFPFLLFFCFLLVVGITTTACQLESNDDGWVSVAFSFTRAFQTRYYYTVGFFFSHMLNHTHTIMATTTKTTTSVQVDWCGSSVFDTSAAATHKTFPLALSRLHQTTVLPFHSSTGTTPTESCHTPTPRSNPHCLL